MKAALQERIAAYFADEMMCNRNQHAEGLLREAAMSTPYGSEYSSICDKCGWPKVVHGDPESSCRPRYKCPPPFDLMVRDAINRLKDNDAI